jgi:hypothetical protein
MRIARDARGFGFAFVHTVLPAVQVEVAVEACGKASLTGIATIAALFKERAKEGGQLKG